ncbi:MAG: zinc-dependent peptidase [Lysobacterales bacterium]|nr:MAG: zinc-dependent peptidase [Xanthomonadales bacterium]
MSNDTLVLSYKAWRRRRILKRMRIPEHIWSESFARLPVLHNLSDDEFVRLRDLATLFLHDKVFEGADSLILTDAMRVTVALQACLPILNLGLDWYDGWVSVILYPAGFIPSREYTDETGVVHRARHALSGESWLRGPVILSWPDVLPADTSSGHNVVIHEFAHKLDMLDGAANGVPPLHPGMSVDRWAEVFSKAYADFQDRIERSEETAIDPYGAEEPEEFFAVLSEIFFEQPLLVEQTYPAVYRQLAGFYRQDTAARERTLA